MYFFFSVTTQTNAAQYNFFLNLFPALIDYLGKNHQVVFPPDPVTSCIIRTVIVFTSALWGVLLILAMTFDRFYGIVRPHLAVSIKTVTKARTTCVFIIILGTIYNIPHVFLAASKGYDCVPYEKVTEYKFGELFYWLSFVINYSFPFVALLTMNSFIIHTIRNRTKLATGQSGQHQKSSEIQIFIILLLVTFSFLLLTTPAYMLFLFNMIIDFSQSPKYQAGSQLFYSLAQKTWYTNNGINFWYECRILTTLFVCVSYLALQHVGTSARWQHIPLTNFVLHVSVLFTMSARQHGVFGLLKYPQI